MSLLVSTLNYNKSLSTSEKAVRRSDLVTASNQVYVYSDEIIELDLTERSHGRFIDVIKPAQDERIKAARAKDTGLGVFVYYGVVRA